MRKYFQVLLGVSGMLLLFSAAGQAEVTPGDLAPDFTLKDSFGVERTLSDYKGKLVVLEWINHDCPFVRKHYNSGNMQKLQKHYTEAGVVWLSISSSAPGNQGHYLPDDANRLTQEKGAHPTAVLLDSDGNVGHLYGAQTTPHMFVINTEGRLIYQGAIDNVKSTDIEDIDGAVNYVQEVLDAALAGKDVEMKSTKSYGCSVKY